MITTQRLINVQKRSNIINRSQGECKINFQLFDTYFYLDDTISKIEEGDKFKRYIQIASIRALTQSNEEENEQLIVHVKDDFDLILQCDNRLDLVAQIIKCYHFSTKANLAIYGLPGGLDFFLASRGDQNSLPAEKYRQIDKGLYSIQSH